MKRTARCGGGASGGGSVGGGGRGEGGGGDGGYAGTHELHICWPPPNSRRPTWPLRYELYWAAVSVFAWKVFRMRSFHARNLGPSPGAGSKLIDFCIVVDAATCRPVWESWRVRRRALCEHGRHTSPAAQSALVLHCACVGAVRCGYPTRSSAANSHRMDGNTVISLNGAEESDETLLKMATPKGAPRAHSRRALASVVVGCKM